jgi:RNA polymerase sigma-70 factor (ECF subfamily)
MAALRSHAEADEATQDAFVLAWRRLGSYRGESSFKTWLLSIAWHQAINRRRGLVRWLKRTVQIEDIEVEPAGVASGFSRTISGNPEQRLAAGELRRDIGEAIRALSPKLRDALLLAQSGEYSYEEIGAMLGVALGTIKWRVSEARRLVKQRLRKRGHDELG